MNKNRKIIFDEFKNEIVIHDNQDFIKMRQAGALASKVLDYIEPFVIEGTSTNKLDNLCHNFILQNNAVPAPLNYKGFPKSICTSVNHVVCHGIPGEKVLKKNDIVNIDITVILDGWHGDTSRMFVTGKPKIKAKNLIEITFEAMWKGINQVKPGNTVGDIGSAIQKFAESQGYSIVKDFCGHGIGQKFHTAPNILHYGESSSGVTLEEGMFFTIEPMINLGKKDVLILEDGWTAVTRDKKLSAQYEHTIGVTKTGYEIFTISEKEKKEGKIFCC
ncbi:MAG: Methionine aminopeptidase [Alphaproteobacteria bacterium MarineAlpha9_Bin4]|nr:type I methionyl aminopeptidase [Pelagibacterales bacterium]PPR27459.1 MAG: Methionine aminopeptidase [Alphaproteobacteria bacterium MarineAlpha9_Bin4]|tara:strand:- start:126 stop:950 length:825 start_codon:yes stop_codon:yes gene_type:complete